MPDKIEGILNKLHPNLMIRDGVVKVKLTGACAGCPMSTMTLKMGIERILKQEVSEVKEVIAV